MMTTLAFHELHAVAPAMTPYRLHQLVWEMLYPGSRGVTRNFQYSATPLDGETLLSIRSLSASNPSLPWEHCRHSLRAGITMDFRLRSAPVIRDGKRGTETPLTGEAAEEWLARIGRQNGFHPAIHQHHTSPHTFSGKDGHRVTLNETHFAGRLVVQEPVLFAKALAQGVGRHKGFGLGMIQLPH